MESHLSKVISALDTAFLLPSIAASPADSLCTIVSEAKGRLIRYAATICSTMAPTGSASSTANTIAVPNTAAVSAAAAIRNFSPSAASKASFFPSRTLANRYSSAAASTP